jgi:bifunctional non-homologous end joining protein LigD
MVDQLSLRLDASLPRLPRSLQPMTAVPATEPFDSADYLFEPNWGGARALAFVEIPTGASRPTVRIHDEAGRDMTAHLPELADLTERFNAESVVVDGELVVVDRMGRCNGRALARRLAGKTGSPVAFLAFDLVVLDGRPLLSTPLTRRRELLRRVLRPGEELVAVPSIAGEGRALYAAVVEAGLAGVMARASRSPYLPGVRSRLWRFVPWSEAAAGAETASERRGSAAGETGAGTQSDRLSTSVPGDEGDILGGPRNAPVLALIRRLPLDDIG